MSEQVAPGNYFPNQDQIQILDCIRAYDCGVVSEDDEVAIGEAFGFFGREFIDEMERNGLLTSFDVSTQKRWQLKVTNAAYLEDLRIENNPFEEQVGAYTLRCGNCHSDDMDRDDFFCCL